MDQVEAARLERRIAVPADVLQPVLDVRLRLRPVERAQVIRRDHALAQLLHLRTLHHRAQLRLADEEALQQRLVAELEIRQHAQLLDRARRQVLRLVDDQQRALLVDGELAQERLQRREQDRLVDRLHRQPERRRHGAQQVVRVELRAHELDSDDLGGIELLQKAPHDRRLAGADLAGDDDEALALVEPVLEVRERALVARGCRSRTTDRG